VQLRQRLDGNVDEDYGGSEFTSACQFSTATPRSAALHRSTDHADRTIWRSWVDRALLQQATAGIADRYDPIGPAGGSSLQPTGQSHDGAALVAAKTDHLRELMPELTIGTEPSQCLPPIVRLQDAIGLSMRKRAEAQQATSGRAWAASALSRGVRTTDPTVPQKPIQECGPACLVYGQ
jgi:hypothetical protein